MPEYNYKPNSNKSKEEQKEKKKIEKVVKGSAKTRKKSGIHKFTDIFVSEDINNVKNYIFMDVLVPAVKDAISSVVKNGIDMLVYGESSGVKKRTGASKVSYRDYYDRGRTERPRVNHTNGFDYDDIEFDNRGDAEAVLSAMDDIIYQYGFVSVSDFYELANVTTNNYMTNKYGWTDIHSAEVRRVRGGWMIKLPRPLPID